MLFKMLLLSLNSLPPVYHTPKITIYTLFENFNKQRDNIRNNQHYCQTRITAQIALIIKAIFKYEERQ